MTAEGKVLDDEREAEGKMAERWRREKRMKKKMESELMKIKRE